MLGPRYKKKTEKLNFFSSTHLLSQPGSHRAPVFVLLLLLLAIYFLLN